MESVFLGILDEEVKDDNCSWLDNKLGGHPVYSSNCKSIPTKSDIICSNCQSVSAFIFQISCPIDSSPIDRVLYCFFCLNPNCDEHEMFLFRVISPTNAEPTSTNENLFEDNWDDDISDEPKLISSVQKLSLEEKVQHELIEDCVYFKPHYISVIEEPSEKKLNKNEIAIYEKKASLCDGSQSGNDGYEKFVPEGFRNDKNNYRFYKRLRRYPMQIIRYELFGTPLRSSSKEFQLEACPYCQSVRSFELQVMPHLINVLHQTKNSKIKELTLDFETIIMFTCSKNCSTQNFFKEQLILFKES